MFFCRVALHNYKIFSINELLTRAIVENKTYSYDEAYNASLDYFGGDELAARVWVSKYALKDSFGNIYEKTPDDMHMRLASEISRIESKYPVPMPKEEVFGLLKDFKYIVPQGSPMSGIGNSYQVGSLSNCFVIGLDGAPDSYGGVIRIDEEQVQLMKRRGGVGHDLSHIRPKGTPVKNSALTSTGLVPFMERYSNSTREVAQGRTSWRSDADRQHKTSRCRGFYRRQNDRRQGHRAPTSLSESTTSS